MFKRDLLRILSFAVALSILGLTWRTGLALLIVAATYGVTAKRDVTLWN